jgi:hypothetical protein
MNFIISSIKARYPEIPTRRLFRWMLPCLLIIFLYACAQNVQIGQVDIIHPPTKAPTPTLLPPKEIDLAGKLDERGNVISALVLDAPDNCFHVEIKPGTTVLDPTGKPPLTIVIRQMYPGKPPMEAYSVPISYAYRFGPGDFHFSTAVKLVFTCLKNYKKSELNKISVGIKNDTSGWDQISVQGNDQIIWTSVDSLLSGWNYYLLGPAPMGS